MLNIGQKTILLLNVSASDAGSLSAFISDDVHFITASDISSAIETVRTSYVDMIITDASHKAELLQKTSDSKVSSRIPILSVERSFDKSQLDHCDVEDNKRGLFESGALFGVLKSIFPLAVTCNLSKDTCNIIQYMDYSKDIDNKTTVFSQLVSKSAAIASPAHRITLIDTLSPKKLCRAMKSGEGSVRITYRSLGNDKCWHWFETIVLNIENPYDDDVLAIVLSRSVDEQKDLEERLLRTIDETTEELEKKRYYEQFTYDAVPAAIAMYYLDWRPMPYINGNLFKIFGYSPEEIEEMHQKGLRSLINEEDLKNANTVLRKASDDGIDRLTLEYRMYKKDGTQARVQEVASRFVDEDGSVGFISVFTDITDRYEMLEQLRSKERIMNIVGEHSGRIVYYYDIAKNELRSINPDDAVRGGLSDLCVDPVNTLFNLSMVHPEFVVPMGDFLNLIRSGENNGSLKLQMTCLDGIERWFDVRFTSLPSEDGGPVGAVVSLLDITAQHDREISHERYRQTIDTALSNESVFFEIDLSSNTVEKQIGVIAPFTESFIDMPYTSIVDKLTSDISKRKEQRRVRAYLALEKLLDYYENAQRRISDDWPITLEDGHKIWIHCSVQLVSDPYTKHIKMHMALKDVTEQKLKQLNIIYQAENDGLTGLYNRTTIEHKISESLAKDYSNSVFILIDLDDLKHINDTLGHAQGDRAICAVSDELISTFKRIGMEGRLGGDEFLVFLPNYPSINKLDDLISGLLRRLANIMIGENNDNSLHCSFGIAIADSDAHDFAALYKRADTALYHIKRNGKNDFAYFSDEMVDEVFRYKYSTNSLKNNSMFENSEFKSIMNSLSNFYPQIVLSNLSKNTMLTIADPNGFSSKLPQEGSFTQFIDKSMQSVHPDHIEQILPRITRDAMLAEYEKGNDHFFLYCRLSDDDKGNERWIAFINLFYRNADGDVCELSLIKHAHNTPIHQDAMKFQRELESSGNANVDFACVISRSTGRYELYYGSAFGFTPFGFFDEQLSSNCGSSLHNISDILKNTSRCVLPFSNGKKSAHFTTLSPDSGDIIMVVCSKN